MTDVSRQTEAARSNHIAIDCFSAEACFHEHSRDIFEGVSLPLHAKQFLDLPLRPLEVPITDIQLQTIKYVIDYLTSFGHRPAVIEHPRPTFTCEEKAALFAEYPDLYGAYGEIGIAQGSLLVMKHKGLADRYMICAHDSNSRIPTKTLRKELGIHKKKGDLRLFHGEASEVSLITGLETGGISPLVSPASRLSAIRFDDSLLVGDVTEPSKLYDFAFSQQRSLLVNPVLLYFTLKHHPFFGALLPKFPVGSIPGVNFERLCSPTAKQLRHLIPEDPMPHDPGSSGSDQGFLVD